MKLRPKREVGWSERERAQWQPPEELSVSDWAERHREIVSKDAAEPGRWRNARTPYLRGVMDALSDDAVEEVYVVKPARIGGSEVGRNFLAHAIAQDPGAFLIVFPSEDKAKEQLRNEIFPLLDTSALKPFQTGSLQDLKSDWIELRNMRIYPAWAGSPTTLAERTIRYVWLSEVDKFPRFSGREADPMSLAKRRTQTWGIRKKIYAESTPTTRQGAIWLAADACPDKRRFQVPCLRCGVLQILTWSQVKWPKYEGEKNLGRRELAERIKAEESAWYECPHCHGKMLDTEKGEMEARGLWVSEGKPGSIVAFFLSGLLSMLGLTWSRMAAQWLMARESQVEGDVGPLMEFVTQSLGEPFEDVVGGVKATVFSAKRDRGHEPRVVPGWASILLTSVDTQKDYFCWITRAWGVFLGDGGRRVPRSRLIDWGKATTFDDLRRATLDHHYPIEGFPAETLQPHVMAIDARGGTSAATDGSDSSRTDEVYRFSKSDPSRIIPVMGHGGDKRQVVPIRTSRVEYKPPNRTASPYYVTLHVLDVQHYADCLSKLIEQEASKPDEEGKVRVPEVWELCTSIDEDYVSHLTGEVKVAVRKKGQVEEVWQKRSAGRRVDWLDCERYNLALADIMRVEGSPDETSLHRTREEASKKRGEISVAPAPRSQADRASPAVGRFAPRDGRSYLVCNRKPQ